MSQSLPNAPAYRHVHETMKARIVSRGNRVINLDTITNEQIEQLLNEDVVYWSKHFGKKRVRKKKKESEPSGEDMGV